MLDGLLPGSDRTGKVKRRGRIAVITAVAAAIVLGKNVRAN